jgi:DNA sulfur modification protein DndE
MSQLKLQRIRFSVEADNRLRMLKARTGLTPNLLCRLGVCLSFGEPGEPVNDASEMSPREINRYTLLGEYDKLFVALFLLRHPEAGSDAALGERLFVQHVHRGITMLANRVKTIASVAELGVGAASSVRPRVGVRKRNAPKRVKRESTGT